MPFETPNYQAPGEFDGDPQEVEEQTLIQLAAWARLMSALAAESAVQLRSSELSRLLRADPSLDPGALADRYETSDRKGAIERVTTLAEALARATDAL